MKKNYSRYTRDINRTMGISVRRAIMSPLVFVLPFIWKSQPKSLPEANSHTPGTLRNVRVALFHTLCSEME